MLLLKVIAAVIIGMAIWIAIPLISAIATPIILIVIGYIIAKDYQEYKNPSN